jgi:hypothetical protein
MKIKQIQLGLTLLVCLQFAVCGCQFSLANQPGKAGISKSAPPIPDDLPMDSKTMTIFDEMLGEAIRETSNYISAHPTERKILFGGIGVLPNLSMKDPLKKSLAKYMNDTNILSDFYASGVRAKFIDIDDINDGEKAYDVKMPNVKRYNRFFITSFARNFPEHKAVSEQYVGIAGEFRHYQSVDCVMYGYFFHSKKTALLSPGSLFFVLKLSRIGHHREGHIYPIVEHICVIEKKIDSEPAVVEKQKEKDIIQRLFKTNQSEAIEPPPEYSYRKLIVDDPSLEMARELSSEPWGIIPTTSLPEKWGTILLMDLAQDKLLDLNVPLIDTTMIRDHLFYERNRNIIPSKKNIEDLVPNIIVVSILNNISNIENYHFKTSYYMLCPKGTEGRDFKIAMLFQKNIASEIPGQYLSDISEEIVERIEKHNPFQREFDGKPISNLFVENYNGWPSQEEKEIFDVLKYKIVKRILQKHGHIYVPLDSSELSRDMQIDIGLELNKNKWTENVYYDENNNFGFFSPFRVRYQGTINEEIELFSWQKSETGISIDDVSIVAEYIRTKIKEDLQACRNNTQRLLSVQLYQDAVNSTYGCYKKFIEYKDKFTKAYSEGEWLEIQRSIEADIHKIESNKTIEFAKLIRKGDIETIFLYDQEWDRKALSYYRKAQKLAEKNRAVDFSTVAKKKINGVKILKQWMKFRKDYQKAEIAKSEKRWNTARKYFKICFDTVLRIKHHSRVKESKPFISKDNILKDIQVVLNVEELLDDAERYENNDNYDDAYDAYEKAEILCLNKGGLDVFENYLREAQDGKERVYEYIR